MAQFTANPKEHASHPIDALTLKTWLEETSVLLVDVREAGEYANEHIPGARCVPLSRFNLDELQPNPNQPLVLYCQSGNRSARAAQQLAVAGVTPIHELKHGIMAWKNAGYALAKEPGAPMSLFRQVQIVAGFLITLGVGIGLTLTPWGFALTGFVGLGLMFAGITNTCALGMLLAKLPYNRRANQRWS